jgi:hypothetical protein
MGGENENLHPTHFQWTRKGKSTKPTFFTDGFIKQAVKFGPPKPSIAWLVEPRSLHPENYTDAAYYESVFGDVLSYDKHFLDKHKFSFYPYGGSWIDLDAWGMHEKYKDLSIIASSKKSTSGHKLRHDIISEYADEIDSVFGHGYSSIDTKITGLAPYRYSIVVESSRFDYYFTEKLIDAISVGCVPIYWGCPSIGDFFDIDGIIPFMNMTMLGNILKGLCAEGYRDREQAIRNNIEIAKEYRCCEDWIWLNRPDIFERS